MLDIHLIDPDIGLQKVCENIATIVDDLDAQTESIYSCRDKNVSNINDFEDTSEANQPNNIQTSYQGSFEQSNLQQQEDLEYYFKHLFSNIFEKNFFPFYI